jgi:hypothetical protein
MYFVRWMEMNSSLKRRPLSTATNGEDNLCLYYEALSVGLQFLGID